MSLVFADAELLATAATDLANIGSTISTASNTAAAATIGVLPPALDEVSASIAALFGAHGQAYQQLSTQLEEAGQVQAGLAAGLARAELAFNETLVAGETALGQAVAGVDGALGGALIAGFNAVNSLVYAGEQFVNTLAGAPVAPNLSASLLVGGSVQGGGQFLAGLIPTGQLLTGGFDSAIDGLAVQLSGGGETGGGSEIGGGTY
ncbi:PE family protein [Mycobacterium gastri]|uniref:PE domain-containing protein n=1 Tax=Mycobacterium gastri TaxID=1777 RepID=A0A1X1UPV7_MYCGS|nr:PE family protein [Mycobacterium gastri]ETW23755.1 hypothetical protein MGAST_12510 [Mycobacterium gastri 'Wayne']ORV58807.1 hypothetical protein AWC07_19970 [Mycobacterium gastri]